jgi:hypothetical protein
VEDEPGADNTYDGQAKSREIQRVENETGGQQTKCTNKQTETVGDSYAKVNS